MKKNLISFLLCSFLSVGIFAQFSFTVAPKTNEVKQGEIQVEIQNTSKSQIFIKYEGSIRGSSFLGAGTVTRYKVKPGDKILDKKTGAVLVHITASTKPNSRIKI